MSGKASTLAARIHREASDIQHLVVRAKRLLDKAKTRGEFDILDGAALNLHAYYAAAERIFEDIAREIDGAVPPGGDGHRALLLQMSAPVIDVRPAVIGEETYCCLDEYRGFRHVVRNVYTFNLRPDRIEALVNELPSCYALLAKDIEKFVDFLVALDRSE